jgi:hypothetical protein
MRRRHFAVSAIPIRVLDLAVCALRAASLRHDTLRHAAGVREVKGGPRRGHVLRTSNARFGEG